MQKTQNFYWIMEVYNSTQILQVVTSKKKGL